MDLTQEWTQIKCRNSNLNSIQNSSNSNSNNGDDDNKSNQKNGNGYQNRRFPANHTNVVTCSFCRRENHSPEDCYSHPNASSCKFPPKLRESLKAMPLQTRKKRREKFIILVDLQLSVKSITRKGQIIGVAQYWTVMLP